MLSVMVQEMGDKDLDFISGIPREEMYSFGEKITVPFINYSILSIFPICLSYLTRFLYFFMFANGQFMMFKREAYEKINGHMAVKGEVVEDIELSKMARRFGLRVGIYNLTDIVFCRMYRNFRDAFLGLSKSYFSLFQMRLIPSLFVWIWIFIITISPFYWIIRYSELKLGGIAIAKTLLIWFIISFKLGLPRDIPFYYPIISIVNSLIGLFSIVVTLIGKSSWKGRVLDKKIRLF